MKLRLATCVRCAMLLTGLAMAPYPDAFASAAETRHHYEITGGLTAAADPSVVPASTHFSALAPHVTQAGEHFDLAARLAAAPDGCASDTIFQNGFDP
jgi:hypothetical protein